MSQLIFNSKRFEEATRKALGIFDRPLFQDDLKNVTKLDCSGFKFYSSDIGILIKLSNLTEFILCTDKSDLKFLTPLSSLERLFLEIDVTDWFLSFSDFKNLRALKYLHVIGAENSDFKIYSLEALKGLPNLKHIGLEFLKKSIWRLWKT